MANGSGAWTYDSTATTLPEGIHSFDATQTVSEETSHSSEVFQVVVSTIAQSVSCELRQTAALTTSAPVWWLWPPMRGITEGATVTLDVDLDNDGNFTEPGGTGTTTGALSNGIAFFMMNGSQPFCYDWHSSTGERIGAQPMAPLNG